jgi:hypothetical protein
VIPALLSVVLIHLLKIKNDKGGNDTQEKLIPAARVNTKILFAVCMIAVGFTLFYSIVNMSRYYFGYDSEIYSFGEDETIRTVYIVSILLCAVSLVLLLARLIDKKMRLKRWFIVATIVSYSESIILGLIANIGGLLNYALMIGVPAIYMLLLFERIERKGRI